VVTSHSWTVPSLPTVARVWPSRRFLAGVGEECLDVGGELGVVLEQEPVRRVGVDLHPGVWDQAGEQVGVAGKIIGSLSPLATSLPWCRLWGEPTSLIRMISRPPLRVRQPAGLRQIRRRSL
jgi:hypothetical protein